MTPHLASVALQFLMRVNLTGGEVPAFVAVQDALRVIATSQPQQQIPEAMPMEDERACQPQT